MLIMALPGFIRLSGRAIKCSPRASKKHKPLKFVAHKHHVLKTREGYQLNKVRDDSGAVFPVILQGQQDNSLSFE